MYIFLSRSDTTLTVSTGIYTYPFEIELPESLPTSCEGKYGFIRYLASVNIVRPTQPVQTQTVPFTVIKTHNLNASPLFQVSRVNTPQKNAEDLSLEQIETVQ